MIIERHPSGKKRKSATSRAQEERGQEEQGQEEEEDELGHESGGEVVHATSHLSRNFSSYLYPYMLIKEGLPAAVVAAGNTQRAKLIEAIERKHKEFLVGTRPWTQWSAQEQKKQQALLRNSHSQHLRFGKNVVKAAVIDICCTKRNDETDPYLGYAQVFHLGSKGARREIHAT